MTRRTITVELTEVETIGLLAAAKVILAKAPPVPSGAATALEEAAGKLAEGLKLGAQEVHRRPVIDAGAARRIIERAAPQLRHVAPDDYTGQADLVVAIAERELNR